MLGVVLDVECQPAAQAAWLANRSYRPLWWSSVRTKLNSPIGQRILVVARCTWRTRCHPVLCALARLHCMALCRHRCMDDLHKLLPHEAHKLQPAGSSATNQSRAKARGMRALARAAASAAASAAKGVASQLGEGAATARAALTGMVADPRQLALACLHFCNPNDRCQLVHS
jgi:hypothetical protein